MTRDDVIRMAREAGLIGPEDTAHDILKYGLELWVSGELGMQTLERFATLVAAAEREACEQACWDAETNDWEGRKACIDAIRARGNT